MNNCQSTLPFGNDEIETSLSFHPFMEKTPEDNRRKKHGLTDASEMMTGFASRRSSFSSSISQVFSRVTGETKTALDRNRNVTQTSSSSSSNARREVERNHPQTDQKKNGELNIVSKEITHHRERKPILPGCTSTSGDGVMRDPVCFIYIADDITTLIVIFQF